MVEKGKSAHSLSLWSKTPQRTFIWAFHMVHTEHGHYHTNSMVKPDGNNNMMQPSSVWARGPYPVLVGLGEAWRCQSEADHSHPLLTRLNHCLLRQEGRPLQSTTSSSAAPAPCLWLACGFGKGRFVFSPTAKFLKADTSWNQPLEE